jgi:hypothetical protein
MLGTGATETVVSPNEFWLDLHQLATSYSREGLTPEERLANIIDQFRAMPPIAQQELLGDLLRLANNLPDIQIAAVHLANEAKQRVKSQVGR